MSESDEHPQDEHPQTIDDNEEPAQQFALQKIYVKDLSFETPNSPGIFTEKWEPSVSVELNTNGTQLSDDVHEVVLGITVTATLGEKVAYLTEIHQAGIFTIGGFEEDELGAMLGSYCPNILFPFAREMVSELVTKGGFPQMLLAPVNFEAIYQDHLKQAQANKPTVDNNSDVMH